VFRKRLIKPEMLDHLSPEEARPNLADLVRINRHFGGHSVLRKMLESVVRRDERVTMLDIGAASGDTARFVQEHYPEASVTSLDCSPVNLSLAPQPKIVADAFRLPLAPQSFDFVMSSLFLHHFEDEQVVDLLSRFYSIARRALLISDLERHILPYLFLPATKLVFKWCDVTVQDGMTSVRASFRAGELSQLARRAEIQTAELWVQRPAFRVCLVAVKPTAR
jgi:2-polyprenyl-3-methyl-5-hydroxy-6-metoxy-1,4-benzoquinol methylase